jgi:hypothetical protein
VGERVALRNDKLTIVKTLRDASRLTELEQHHLRPAPQVLVALQPPSCPDASTSTIALTAPEMCTRTSSKRARRAPDPSSM